MSIAHVKCLWMCECGRSGTLPKTKVVVAEKCWWCVCISQENLDPSNIMYLWEQSHFWMDFWSRQRSTCMTLYRVKDDPTCVPLRGIHVFRIGLQNYFIDPLHLVGWLICRVMARLTHAHWLCPTKTWKRTPRGSCHSSGANSPILITDPGCCEGHESLITHPQASR